MRREMCAALEAKPASKDEPDGLTIADYEAAFADHRRLVRELDVALNGEAGAAPQASLCDIVAQVKATKRQSSALTEQEKVEAVEAMAKAAYEHEWRRGQRHGEWNSPAGQAEQGYWRKSARATLTALLERFEIRKRGL